MGLERGDQTEEGGGVQGSGGGQKQRELPGVTWERLGMAQPAAGLLFYTFLHLSFPVCKWG